MFSFISETWNPVCGECSHGCSYCWARALADRHKMSKYQGQPRIDEKQINRKFKGGDFVFVQDMSDLFAEDVPREVILRVLKQVEESPDAKFLLLTKNPKRYIDFIHWMPENCVLGATIESDRIEPRLGKAPNRLSRLSWMVMLRQTIDERYELGCYELPLFVSVEPILDFNLNDFVKMLKWLRPWAVAVGMDNYGNGFPEPSLEKTMQLIEELEFNRGIKVFRKTLRDPKIDAKFVTS